MSAQAQAVRRLLRLPQPQGRRELRVGNEHIVSTRQIPVSKRTKMHRSETEMRPSKQLWRQQ